jgi:hypothetical protein
MNIQSNKIDDFINELINEQTYLSQQVKNAEDKQETLKNIKDINQVMSLVYGLKKTMEKQKERKKTTK